MKKEISRKFCVAPMMGYTTPYARKLYRILSNNSFLFSEMIATKSLIYSKSRENIIDNDCNNPVALQVGGSEIDELIEKIVNWEKNHSNNISNLTYSENEVAEYFKKI